MKHIPEINLTDFDYDLPKEKIAQHPLKFRDASKLLIYGDRGIREDVFKNIGDHLPNNAILLVNETRVIHARIRFKKETGAGIEIFCLEPLLPTTEIQNAFEQTSGVTWKCLVGNSKKWRSGVLQKTISYKGKEITLSAVRQEKFEDYSLIRFSWDPESFNFSEILENLGTIPLPPYMQRNVVSEDNERYQTVFAGTEGSVAAPTAALHFTHSLIQKLQQKQITKAQLTLHVGAGTFKPVSSDNIEQHIMHTEKIHVTKNDLENLLNKISDPVIAVGTTSMRTLESLYWHGVKCIALKKKLTNIDIRQWDPYSGKYPIDVSPERALMEVKLVMDENKMESISGQTQLIIVPGYKVRIPDILITNFHMPKSTLLLLVSAFVGDRWKEVYKYALDNDFRFLSYGDSCLFFKQ